MAQASKSKDCKVSYTVLVHIGQVRFGLEGTYVSHLADESNRSCLLDLMSTVQVSSTSADTGVHKVLPSRRQAGVASGYWAKNAVQIGGGF